MKKTLKLIVLIALILTNKADAQGNKNPYIIFQGTADAKYNGEFVHLYNSTLHDSAMVANGTFKFKRAFKEPTIYYFYSSFELSTKHGYSPFGILIDHPSTIHFNADMESLSNSKLTGSVAQELYSQFNEQIKAEEKKLMVKLYAKYGKDYVESNNVDTSTQKYKTLIKEYNELSTA
ncbi:MAG: AhpC/TSA family protein, partial [Mucilaginibacter sp.]|nr:AhpC/TSA family protein [Mucilaginibacter sp.]